MSGGLALYAIADIASHTKDLIELPSNANIVWQVVRSVFLGFTPQAIFVLAFAAIIFLFTISETWMPLARALFCSAPLASMSLKRTTMRVRSSAISSSILFILSHTRGGRD
jgi:hypothetical protein